MNIPTRQIIPTAEPFFLPAPSTSSGQTGCLLIHGFTGTPKEMRWMGEYLNQHGLTCLGIRLAGHATRPKDMIRSRWTDWTASVEDGYSLLRNSVDKIFLIGLSMGGVLSLFMSTRLEAYPEGIKGVVAISTPYHLPQEPPGWWIRFMSYFKPFLRKDRKSPGSDWFDKGAYKDHVSYPLNPVRSAVELKLLLEKMRAALPKINVPVLLIHSKDDRYVLPENLEHIYADIHVSDKTKLYVTESGHVVTRDAARHQVFEAALNFIRRVGSQ